MKVMWYKKVGIPLSRTGYIIQKTGNITTNTKYRQSSSQKKSDKRGILKNTIYGWVRANWLGTLDLGAGKRDAPFEEKNDFLKEASIPARFIRMRSANMAYSKV